MEMFSFNYRLNFYYYIIIFIVFILEIINGQLSCSTRLKILQGGGVAFTTDCSNRGLLEIPYNLQPLTHKLLLNGNRLKDIRKNSFGQLSSLKSLDLSGNDITHLPEGLFQSNGNLQSLDLRRNILHCDWQIWWLVKYSWNLADFNGFCFSPASLQGRGISSLTEDDLIVDCASAKKLKKNAIDGEYRFRIAAGTGAPLHVPVYCHGMDTSEPHEYLTLLAGQSKNYVAISNNNEMSCSGIPGLSPPLVVQFSRIRIVLWNMTIDGTDTTFSNVVVGSGKVSYGSAGSCSSDMMNCVGGVAHIDLRGTPFQIQDPRWSVREDGSVINTVGNSVVLVNCTGTCQACQPIKPFKVSMIDSSVDPFSACTRYFGLIDGKVKDSQITASSHLSEDYQASYGRLLSTLHGGWCAADEKDQQYISIDLGSVMTVSGIATQGHRIKFDWVTSYKLFTSDNGTNWVPYNGLSNSTQIFEGNFDRDTVVTHWFKPRFRARFVRIYPLTWYQRDLLNHHICLRLELFGCKSDAVSYVIHSDKNKGCLLPTTTSQSSANYVKLGEKCEQPNAMFAFHHLGTMVHTSTGKCLSVNANSELVTTRDCKTQVLNFQMIPKHSSSDSSLIIKSLINDMCASMKHLESSGKVILTWKDCSEGGFTIFTASHSGIMPFKPSFIDPYKEIKTKLNHSVSLNCKPNGDPLPQAAWTKDNAMVSGATHVIQNSSFLIFCNDNSLILPKVQWQDRGRYFCNVWNSAGNTYKEVVLNVEAFQEFLSIPKDLEVLSGDRATLDCLSVGTPPPRVSWFAQFGQNSSPINVDLLDGVSQLSNGTLMINQALPSYNGVFKCVSESPGFKRNRSASLTVLVPPNIYLSHKQKSVYIGDALDIDCIATGDPFPNITWFKVDNSTKMDLLESSNGKLSIKSASKQDAGVYVCEAESRIGFVNTTFTLNVTATCPFSLMPFSIVVPFKSLYMEEDEIVVKCSIGFKLVGQSRLKCLDSQAWNFKLPSCQDIDECVVGILPHDNGTLDISDGSGLPTDTPKTTVIMDDTDSDPCDVYAECSNSAGSFQCVCDYGYIGDGFTCQWNPTTTKQPTTNLPSGTLPDGMTIATTVVPTVSLQTLDRMIMGYTMNQVKESDLLHALLAYAKSLERINSLSSKSFILRKILFALWTIVYGSPVDDWKIHSDENLRICSEVISFAIAPSSRDAWSTMQKNTNGTVELIRAFEGYAMYYTQQLQALGNDARQIIIDVSTENLDLRVTNLADLPVKDVSINLMSGGNFGVRIDLPRALAYKGLDGVRHLNSIVYSSLGNLLPKEMAISVNRSAIISPVVSLVISPTPNQYPLSTPFNITFSSSNVLTAIPLCVFWSFNGSLGYGWSDHGCRTIQSADRLSVTCECNHMTHFAVMETGVVIQPLSSDYLSIKFGISSMIGCFIFVILGIVTCLSHVCCSPYGRSDRRVILVNLCLALILGMILISGGLTLASFHLVRVSVSEMFCMILTGALQFFVIGFFSWNLVEAIHIFLLTRTVLAKGFVRLLWFYVIGWGTPLATLTVCYILLTNNVIEFESWCWLNQSLLPLLLVIGCPAIFLLLVTLVLYVWVLISLRSTGQLLTAYAQIQASRIVWCSFVLQILHIATTVSIALFLKFNINTVFHHIFGIVVTIEAIYMLIYHCFLDKVITTAGATDAEIKARNRCSYSTKETITYSAPEQEEPNGNKYKITRPTKRDSVDAKSLVTNGNKPTRNVELEWDNHYPDMYGSYQHLPSSPETPNAKTHPEMTSSSKTPTKDGDSRSSYGSDLDGRKSCGGAASPSRTQTQMSNLSDDNRFRPSCRSNSIVSVETKASGSTAQGIPVYWPSAPPQHHMSLKRSHEQLHPINDDYRETSFDPPVAPKRDPPTAKPRPPPLQILDNESPANRHRSYVETDRVSDISNELTGILQELEVLNSDIDKSPLRSHSNTISGHGIRPAPPKYGGNGARTLESKRLLDKSNDDQVNMHINMYGNF